MQDDVHISGLVVHSRPLQAQAIADTLQAMPGVVLHGGTDTGKLVVTLETGTEDEIVARLNAIQMLDGVLAASLVFHHFEPALPKGPSHGCLAP
ncbi:Chaperone NapD [Rhodovastum atsumiense]|nr:chaperone NapD [Rhodovastum atsumiense]CAH2601813.1 Chaperone NapD [Rhodovastum atsumiense]